MCIDSDAGVLYLYGGWDGSRELGDLWMFMVASSKWTCLSPDTAAQVNPSLSIDAPFIFLTVGWTRAKILSCNVLESSTESSLCTRWLCGTILAL